MSIYIDNDIIYFLVHSFISCPLLNLLRVFYVNSAPALTLFAIYCALTYFHRFILLTKLCIRNV